MNSVDNTGAAEADDTSGGAVEGEGEGERIAYGGGFQSGGGMVEPEEFIVGSDDEGLPNDALAEGLSRAGKSPGAGTSDPVLDPSATIDPAAAPAGNDTGDRIGDVAGYLGSDQVVEIDPSARGSEGTTDA